LFVLQSGFERPAQVSRLTVKALLTDMDGTFTKFNLDYLGMHRAALQLLEEAGLSRPGFSDQMSIYLMLKELRPTLTADRFNQIKQRIYQIVEKIEIDCARDAQLTPGAREALNELRQMRKKMIIVTNNGKRGTERTLERLQLTGFFDGVVTRDHTNELKPDPEMLLKALSIVAVRPDEAVVVGDSTIDIRAARAVPMRSISVPTGPVSLARLLEEGPDFIVSSFLDVPRLVRRLDDEA